MDLVDTHCHLYFRRFDCDRDEALRRARGAGVNRVIVPAIDLESCRQAIALSSSADGVFAAVGVHPNSSGEFEDSAIEALRGFAGGAKVIAIGEIGLDYHWAKSPKAQQWRAFESQLELAAELELPAIIHNRDASADVLNILEDWAQTAPAKLCGRLGVLHSFSAGFDIAERALALGFYLGFTGPITFKNADELRSVARRVPIDRLLIETDAPFLAPQPRRGKRNEPAYIRYINDKLADLRGFGAGEMARQTTRNAERLFALPSL